MRSRHWTCRNSQIRYLIAVAVALTLPVAIPHAWAADPLVGTWRLDRQEINGEKTNSEPLTLKISQSGGKFAFAFSVPVNDVYFVSMTYTLRPDGTAADVKNSRGDKIGSIRMTPAGSLQYSVILQGHNRPESSGKLVVSPDGRTLVSESETIQAGRTIHSRQQFSRY